MTVPSGKRSAPTGCRRTRGPRALAPTEGGGWGRLGGAGCAGLEQSLSVQWEYAVVG